MLLYSCPCFIFSVCSSFFSGTVKKHKIPGIGVDVMRLVCCEGDSESERNYLCERDIV